MTDRKPLILVGGGGHCRSCIDVIEGGAEFCIAGIVEQPGKNREGAVLGYPVLGDDNALPDLNRQYAYALITIGQIGSSKTRQRMFEKLTALGFVLPVIISHLAHVSRHAAVGAGTIVMHHAVVNAGASVGKNCILNTKSLVEHDAGVGDHTHISTAAIINGGATIGSGSFVGSNTVVINGLDLPERFFYKAGSLVVGQEDGKPIKDS